MTERRREDPDAVRPGGQAELELEKWTGSLSCTGLYLYRSALGLSFTMKYKSCVHIVITVVIKSYTPRL